MKHWMRMGVAALVASLMMGYGQVSAQVHDTTYEAVGSTASMPYGVATSSASTPDGIAGTSELMSDDEVGVPLGTYLAMEKKKKQEKKKQAKKKRQSSWRC